MELHRRRDRAATQRGAPAWMTILQGILATTGHELDITINPEVSDNQDTGWDSHFTIDRICKCSYGDTGYGRISYR